MAPERGRGTHGSASWVTCNGDTCRPIVLANALVLAVIATLTMASPRLDSNLLGPYAEGHLTIAEGNVTGESGPRGQRLHKTNPANEDSPSPTQRTKIQRAGVAGTLQRFLQGRSGPNSEHC